MLGTPSRRETDPSLALVFAVPILFVTCSATWPRPVLVAAGLALRRRRRSPC
jgi:hypothetical protein